MLAMPSSEVQTVRIRQITIPRTTENDLILQISETISILELQKLISRELHITEAHQKLYYGGKELFSEHTVADYKIRDNDVIQLMVRNIEKNGIEEEDDDSSHTTLVNTSSKYYRVGDLIDVVYIEIGAWFEAKIIGIFTESNKKNASDEDFIFQVVMDRGEQTAPMNVKFADIRPRATYFYNKSELSPGMVVFVNYNIQKPRQRGYWYDFKIVKINRSRMLGELLLHPHLDNLDNCFVKLIDGVMRKEEPKLLNERNVDIEETIPLRKLPLYCKKCKDDSTKDCRQCSCHVCGKKHSTDKLIICEECEDTYHLFCLNPSLEEVPPEPEWYCPECKTDESEIVKPGEKLKSLPHKHNENNNELPSIACQKFVGPVCGVSVGTSWSNRLQVFESGIHGNPSGNIYSEDRGVSSIILDGEHEVYLDEGDEFYYSIPSRNNSSNRQTISTKLSVHSTNIIKRLTLNCHSIKRELSNFGRSDVWKRRKPIRIIRSSNIRCVSKFAPKSGYRYDGIYKVVEYFPVIDSGGTHLLRFLMRRDDPTVPPWITVDENSNLETDDVDSEKPSKIPRMDLSHSHFNEIMKFISDDSVNKKLWNECRMVLEQGKEQFQQFQEKVKELFTCVCCCDVLCMPVTTDCKHNICYECLKKCFAADNYNCPYCRLQLKRSILTNINRNLNSALKLIFPSFLFHI